MELKSKKIILVLDSVIVSKDVYNVLIWNVQNKKLIFRLKEMIVHNLMMDIMVIILKHFFFFLLYKKKLCTIIRELKYKVTVFLTHKIVLITIFLVIQKLKFLAVLVMDHQDQLE